MTTTAPGESSLEPPRAAGKFYGIDSRKVSLREYGYGAKNTLQWVLVMPIALILKTFRISIPSSTDDLPVESLEPFLTTGEAFPEDIWARMHPKVAQLEDLGFHVASYHLIEDAAHLTTTYYVTMSGPGNIVGRVHLRIWRQTTPAKLRSYFHLLTQLRGGGFVWSSSGAADLSWPPECVMVRKVDAAAADLLALHQSAVAAQRDNIVPLRDVDDVLNLVNAHHALVTAFHLRRGVFGEMNPREVAQAQKARTTAGTPADPARTIDLRYQLIIDEIEKRQNAKAGWLRTFMLLLVSLAIFVVGGRAGWAKQDFLFLIPILFFHELGHYLTMRLFGYRNLRMFFIPMFGAAVMGRNYNVPGWKKAVVALMGPVPGVLVGIALGIAGLIIANTTMTHVAVLLLIINGLNLLPILPLDGGHVFQAVLFSRHYALDVSFRIAAILCLAVAAALLGGQSMLYLAILMGAGIPLAYRLGKVTYDLRHEGVAGISANDQQIPPEVAIRIIDKLTASRRTPVANRTMAQQVLLVFESLNARPPNWVASILLLMTQGGAVVAAIICSLIFIWSEQGVFKNWRAMMQQATQQPKHRVVADANADWTGRNYAFAGADKERTVVATFDNSTRAQTGMAAIVRDLPPTAALRRFSDTLFITFPDAATADANHLFDALAPQTKDLYIQTTSQGSGLRLMAIPPTLADAGEIKQELDEYLNTVSSAPLEIPPWEATRWVSADDYARFRLARATLLKMRKEVGSIYRDPAFKALSTRIGEAYRRSDKDAIAKMDLERKELTNKLRQEKIDAMKTWNDADVDQPLVTGLLAEPKSADGNPLFVKLPPNLAARLGLIPDSASKNPEAAESAKWGSATNTGMIMTIYATFPAAEHGAPALCHWLEQKKCTHLLYEIHSSPNDLDDFD